ncbi:MULTISPECIES: immunity protein [Bacillus]|uniref:immunity protein n=1 Tax=Bacillus TaxID=1386 RepID=UPI0028FBB748|nr:MULTISPECIES: immunity protein [Bacillus]MDU0072032.1 immunity protein [Bacillus sp. IG6]MED8019709.1 immunity protein [Bacillus glycinifermentans]
MNNKLLFYLSLGVVTLFFYFIDKAFAIILTLLGLSLLGLEPYRIRNKKLTNEFKNNVEMLKEYDSDFNSDGSFANDNSKISFNETKGIFKIYKRNEQNEIVEFSYPFSKIVESSISLDNETVSKTSRGEQITGAAIGGVLAGGVGAIIGGLSSGSKQVTMVKSITMKATVDDFKNPVHYIDFLPCFDTPDYSHPGFKKDSDIIKTALKKADYWQGVMDLAIRKTNQVAH